MGWPEDIPHQNSDNMSQDALWILNARYSEQDGITISMHSYLTGLFVLSVEIPMYILCLDERNVTCFQSERKSQQTNG